MSWFGDYLTKHAPDNPPPVRTPEEQAIAEKVCARKGHDDVDRTRPLRAWPMVECVRCGRVGWRAPA